LAYGFPKFGTLRATQFLWDLLGEEAPKMGQAKSMNRCYHSAATHCPSVLKFDTLMLYGSAEPAS